MTSSYPHITSDPGVCGGRPCIAETGVRVTEVAAALEEGRSVNDLLEYFSSRPLTLGEVYAALGYFHDHREQLDLAHAEDQRVSAEAERLRLDAIKRHFLGQ